MINEEEVLCEIIFKDHKSGVLTSRIGRIYESNLTLLSPNSNDFIIFKEKYNSPIIISDIIEIIVHRKDKKIYITNNNSGSISHINSKNKGKIS